MAKERKDLGYLGEEFQYKLVHTFMEDKEFFKDLSSIINQNMFTHPQLKVIVGEMKNYYEKREQVPSYDTMGIILSDRAFSDIEKEEYLANLKKIYSLKDEDREYIKDLSLKFFKQQNIIKTANEILRIAGDGNTEKYEQCVELLSQALNQGTHTEFGSTVFEGLGETLSDDYRTPIPTGVDKLDECLEGGLGKGELGVIIGSSSFGKTSLTTAMASHAATYKCSHNNYHGYKVLQIVFEDRIKQIQRKHIGRITEIEAKDLSKPDIKNIVEERLKSFKDKDILEQNLRIVRFPSGEITASKLERFVKKMINSGFKPDMMIVDYFECLEHISDGRASNEWEKEGKTMRKLESMAAEMDMAIWIPTQGTRDSVNMELVTMDKAGGSFKKIQIAHIVVSIARTMEDIEANKATIALLKNRAGKSGKVFNNVNFNNGTCIISTDDCDDDFNSLLDFNEKKKKSIQDLTKEMAKAMRK